ncbi:MAG: ComF family protein [Clostridia bacterium]|nr:ComF family protein [Clostridia bacterium]
MRIDTVMDMLSDGLRHLFFPRRCALCAELKPELTQMSPLCPECRAAWRAELAAVCTSCGEIAMRCRCAPKSAGADALSELDGARLRFYHLLPYRPGKRNSPAARILLRLKTKRDADALAFLASQMAPLCECAVNENTETGAPAINGSRADWLFTYTPRSRHAAAENGFDQAEELARTLSRLTGIPVRRCFVRIRGRNTAQKTLDTAGRRENAQKSYRLKPGTELRGKRVLLVDDILTTGATVTACAGMLLDAGAAVCVCLTAAKTDRS